MMGIAIIDLGMGLFSWLPWLMSFASWGTCHPVVASCSRNVPSRRHLTLEIGQAQISGRSMGDREIHVHRPAIYGV